MNEYEKNNLLIAEYMDCVVEKNDIVRRTTKYWDFPGEACGMRCEIKHLQFNSSWDWLMLVVEKIVPPHGQILDGIKYQTNVIDALGTAKIERVYRAVVEFVRWYNENVKNVEGK